nr:hypothetical protein B0A51_05357 [Rachicladosporium sp. CCFEE 5018]
MEAHKQPLHARALRLSPLLMWPFGFSLGLAHGLKTGQALPALTIVPCSFSVLYALVMVRERRTSISRGKLALVDLALCLMHVGFLVPAIVFLCQTAWYYNAEDTMLGSYATVPTMFDLGIHAYLTLVSLPHIDTFLRSLLQSPRPHPETCPNCHTSLKPLPPSPPSPATSPSWFYRLTHPSRLALPANLRPGTGHSHSAKEIYTPLAQNYEYTDDQSDETVQAPPNILDIRPQRASEESEDAFVFPRQSSTSSRLEGGMWVPRASSEIETTPRPSQETLAGSAGMESPGRGKEDLV